LTDAVEGILSSCDAFFRSPILKSDNPMTIYGLVLMVRKMQLIANWKLCDHVRK